MTRLLLTSTGDDGLPIKRQVIERERTGARTRIHLYREYDRQVKTEKAIVIF